MPIGQRPEQRRDRSLPRLRTAPAPPPQLTAPAPLRRPRPPVDMPRWPLSLPPARPGETSRSLSCPQTAKTAHGFPTGGRRPAHGVPRRKPGWNAAPPIPKPERLASPPAAPRSIPPRRPSPPPHSPCRGRWPDLPPPPLPVMAGLATPRNARRSRRARPPPPLRAPPSSAARRRPADDRAVARRPRCWWTVSGMEGYFARGCRGASPPGPLLIAAIAMAEDLPTACPARRRAAGAAGPGAGGIGAGQPPPPVRGAATLSGRFLDRMRGPAVLVLFNQHRPRRPPRHPAEETRHRTMRVQPSPSSAPARWS